MVKHIVMWSFKEEVTGVEREQAATFVRSVTCNRAAMDYEA